MSYAISTTDQFPFQRFLLYSVFLHLALSVVMLADVWLQRSHNQWGSIGGGGDSGFNVNIVAPADILSLQPTNVNDSGVVDPTKSLHKADPLAPEIKPETATEIPKWTRERPLRPSRPSKLLEKKTPDADKAVPGKEDSASIPSGYTNTPGPIYRGLATRGEGGGDFAGRYPWYVQSVVRAISQNWMHTASGSRTAFTIRYGFCQSRASTTERYLAGVNPEVGHFTEIATNQMELALVGRSNFLKNRHSRAWEECYSDIPNMFKAREFSGSPRNEGIYPQLAPAYGPQPGCLTYLASR